MPERVLKQFGLRQGIPPDVPIEVQEHRRLHALTRKGRPSTDWSGFHVDYVYSWHHRQDNTIGGHLTETPETDGGYHGWYWRHTIRHVSNPTRGGQDGYGYQNLGSINSFMVCYVTKFLFVY